MQSVIYDSYFHKQETKTKNDFFMKDGYFQISLFYLNQLFNWDNKFSNNIKNTNKDTS